MASEQTTVSQDEYMILNAIDYGQNEPGVNFENYEVLIPALIQRGLVTQHTVWRLTEAGRTALAVVEENHHGQ